MEEWKYLAIGPFIWAKADTLRDAIREAMKEYHGSKRLTDEDFVVLQVHPDTTIDGLANLSYPVGQKPKRVWTGKNVQVKYVED